MTATFSCCEEHDVSQHQHVITSCWQHSTSYVFLSMPCALAALCVIASVFSLALGVKMSLDTKLFQVLYWQTENDRKGFICSDFASPSKLPIWVISVKALLKILDRNGELLLWNTWHLTAHFLWSYGFLLFLPIYVCGCCSQDPIRFRTWSMKTLFSISSIRSALCKQACFELLTLNDTSASCWIPTAHVRSWSWRHK